MKKRIRILPDMKDIPRGDIVNFILSQFKEEENSSVPEQVYKVTLDPSLTITQEFTELTTVLDSSSKHAFITGKAGTGKSTFLQYFRQQTSKHTVALAPTGTAAINIGGSTIHSFFRFPHHFLRKEDIKKNDLLQVLYNSIDVLLIDEVSMIRPDLLDAIDLALQMNREQKKPFGGVQVVLFGDLFQLPPVVDSATAEFFYNYYPTPYFFSANIIDAVSIPTYELQTIFRQSDPTFIGLLNRIRTKTFTDHDLACINERYFPPSINPFGNDNYITLTSTNAAASAINHEKLKDLRGREYVYKAEISGEFSEQFYPNEDWLALKNGAQVIMLKNDPAKRWVNGTIATVQKLTDTSVRVLVDGEEHEVEPVKWERVTYRYNEEKSTLEPVVVGTFRQYPLMLAWAITIHKSQGKTFDRVAIDLGWGAFAHGQAYVALSRCTSLEGLCLHTPLRPSDIIVDDRIVEFLSSSQQPLSTFRLR